MQKEPLGPLGHTNVNVDKVRAFALLSEINRRQGDIDAKLERMDKKLERIVGLLDGGFGMIQDHLLPAILTELKRPE